MDCIIGVWAELVQFEVTSTPDLQPAAPRRKSHFAGDVLKLVGGTTLAQAITILVAPLLARLYLPDIFGTQAVLVAMVGVLTAIVCLRYEFAILLPKSDEEAANVAATALLSALLVSSVAALILLPNRNLIASLLRAPNIATFIWLVPIALLEQGVFQIMNYWNSRTKHFGRLSIARVAASVTTSASQLGLAALGKATLGSLAGAWIAGTSVFTGTLTIQVLREAWPLFRHHVRWNHVRTSLTRYRKFPLIDSWGGLINTISWQLPTLMLSAFFSQTVVGYYSLSNRVVLLPMTLVGGAIAQVFFQRSAELRHKPELLRTTVETVFRRLVAVGLFPALLLTMAGQELFSVVFGANWVEAGRYAQILGMWVFFLFISSPLSNLFAVLERQELALLVHIAILITRISALMIGGLSSNIYLTLGIWSGTGILVYGGLSLWNLHLAGASSRNAVGIILRYVSYAAPLLGILLFFKWQQVTEGSIVVISVLISCVYYGLLSYRDAEIRDLFSGMWTRFKQGDRQ